MMTMTTNYPATNTTSITTNKTIRIGGIFVPCVFLIAITMIGLKNCSYSTIPIIAKCAITSSLLSSSSASIFRSTRRRRRLQEQQELQVDINDQTIEQEEELQRQEMTEEGTTFEEDSVEAKQKLYEEAQKAEKYPESQRQEQNQQRDESHIVGSLDAGAGGAGGYDEVVVDVKDKNKDLLMNTIPNQFSYDKYYNILPFPRWEFDYSNLNNNIDYQTSIMDSLIDFINAQCESLIQYGNYSLKYTDYEQYTNDLSKLTYSNLLPHTSDHSGIYDTPEGWEPEQLYVVDGEKRFIMTSQYTKDISDANGYSINTKYNPTERLMHIGLNILFNDQNDTEMEQIIPIRWPNLYQLLVIENGSFPFLAQYSDFIGCNYHNWNNNTESIPLFTVAGNVHCNYTIPFPNFALSWGSKYETLDWYNQFQDYKYQYGVWTNRISKLIWRGTLTGKMPKDMNERGPRYHLNYYINNNVTTIEEYNLFDIKLTGLDNLAKNEWIDPNVLGGYSESYKMSQVDFQYYKAILDVDGHSWSSRFASLLCYSSVVLKLEPDYVDYFYSPVNVNDNDDVEGNMNEQQPHRALIPWKHYIPIKRDLSDLVEKVQYVMDPLNEEHVLHIINNANEWCAQRLLLRSQGLDALDIFEKYITILDESTELKNLFQSQNNNNNNIHSNEDNERRLLSASYEDHTDWKTQWNQIEDDIYNSVLQMEPANPAW